MYLEIAMLAVPSKSATMAEGEAKAISSKTWVSTMHPTNCSNSRGLNRDLSSPCTGDSGLGCNTLPHQLSPVPLVQDRSGVPHSVTISGVSGRGMGCEAGYWDKLLYCIIFSIPQNASGSSPGNLIRSAAVRRPLKKEFGTT